MSPIIFAEMSACSQGEFELERQNYRIDAIKIAFLNYSVTIGSIFDANMVKKIRIFVNEIALIR